MTGSNWLTGWRLAILVAVAVVLLMYVGANTLLSHSGS